MKCFPVLLPYRNVEKAEREEQFIGKHVESDVMSQLCVEHKTTPQVVHLGAPLCINDKFIYFLP